jgi:hypothetical protein
MSYANIIFSRFDFVSLQFVLQEAKIMNQGKPVFAQIMSLIPRHEFDKCVKRYNSNRHAIGKVLFERKPLGELFVKPKHSQNDSDNGQLNLWENFFGQ